MFTYAATETVEQVRIRPRYLLQIPSIAVLHYLIIALESQYRTSALRPARTGADLSLV